MNVANGSRQAQHRRVVDGDDLDLLEDRVTDVPRAVTERRPHRASGCDGIFRDVIEDDVAKRYADKYRIDGLTINKE